MRLTADLVDAALARIRPYLEPTPCRRSSASDRLWLKLETEQPTGSFKVRGAVSNVLAHAARPGDSLVTASAGNHGLGVAFAARAARRPERVTIFVPSTAPARKIEKLRTYGVELVIGGRTYDDAAAAGVEHARRTGARYVHAYDDPLTAAGQGTAAPELHTALAGGLPAVEAIVVPVGGGGLVSGIAAWVSERAPAVKVFAAQPAASPALRDSIAAGRALLDYAAGTTIADGLSGGIGEIVFEHRDLIDGVLVVDEAETRAAVRDLFRGDGVRAEGSAGVAVAAARRLLDATRGAVVAIVTGANIDDALLNEILAGA